MLVAAADRDAIRDAWAVGEPYEDVTLASLRVRRPTSDVAPIDEVVTAHACPADVAADHGRSDDRRAGAGHELAYAAGAGRWDGGRRRRCRRRGSVGRPGRRHRRRAGDPRPTPRSPAATTPTRSREWVRDQVALTTGVPPLEAVAAAVADALAAAGLTGVGASGLAVDVHPGGEYRFRLVGTEDDAEVFATAFDEAIGPVGAPRYIVSRFTDAALPDGSIRTRRGARSALRAARATGEAWHPVPTVLGRNATRAGHYLDAWRTWVGEGRLLATAKPEGAGIVDRGVGRGPVRGDHGDAAALVLSRRVRQRPASASTR